MGNDRADLLQGTLDMLILRTLDAGARHGWGIAKHIQQLSADVLQVNQGSLYPALYRLEDAGLIRAKWGISAEGRRAKFYSLTAAGRRRLAAESERWRLFSGAVDAIMAAGG